jgi:hypothetical protein
MPIRLLISARDPAAAYHLTEIVKQARHDARFEITVVAQDPAWSIMRAAGIDATQVSLEKATTVDSAEARLLLERAERILAEFEPDAVLCGLSTPFDGGIDEAILARTRVPSLLLQDFWGERNAYFGRGPDVCLVLDRMAADLTWSRHQLPSRIVGSARHAAYEDTAPVERRAAVRGALGVPPGATVLSLFGQALHALEGYRNTVEAWGDAVKRFPGRRIAAYRKHPRESDDDQRRTRDMFRDAGIDVLSLDDFSVEDALLAGDVIASAFSNCTYDAAYLNFFADRPMLVPVCLFFEPGVVEYFQRIVRLKEWPYLKSGLVLPVYERETLPQALVDAAGDAAKREFWEAAKRNLVSPQGASHRVLDAVAEAALARADGPHGQAGAHAAGLAHG